MAIDYEKEFEGLEKAIGRYSENESGEAYQGFLCYAFLTGKERTIDKVCAATGYNRLTVTGWYSKYDWKNRADQVDAQRWLRDFRLREQQTAKDNEHFVQENRKIKRDGIRIAKKMLSVADNLLDSAQLAGKIVETGEVETKDGRRVKTMTQIHMKSKISDIPRLVDVGIKVARAVNDLPTEPLDTAITPAADLKTLSTEELEKLREDNRDALIDLGVIQKIGSVQ